MGEADRIATLLSPEHGKLRALARGAQKGKSHLSAAVQPFVRARLLLWQGRHLDGISQAVILSTPHALTGDLARFAAASYCCELSDAMTPERQEAPEVYGRLAAALQLLNAEQVLDPAVVLRWFELGMLALGGFQPELGACAACGKPLGEAARLRFSATAGGLLCPGCSGSDPQGVWLSASAQRALRYLASASAVELPRVRVGPATMAQLTSALGRQIEGVLQHPLRSRPLLDTLS